MGCGEVRRGPEGPGEAGFLGVFEADWVLWVEETAQKKQEWAASWAHNQSLVP